MKTIIQLSPNKALVIKYPPEQSEPLLKKPTIDFFLYGFLAGSVEPTRKNVAQLLETLVDMHLRAEL